MQFHIYVDDCQLYTTFETSDINQTALNMEILIDDIRGWYSNNMLKLNDSKTAMMVISSKFRPSVHLDHIKIGESSISPSETVQNLGVIMDSNYTMVYHINNKVQEPFHKIRELSYYRGYLTDESSKTAVHAYVTSRLDYCNILLYGLPKELSKKLQSVMNTAARLVTKTRKFDHITPVLQDLHWLPIESRCKFKILLLVYKCLYGLAPSYLSKRLSLKPNRGLRSDDKLVLNVPITKLKTKSYGDRCWSIAGPNLWNQLPSHIRLSKSIDFSNGLWRHFFSKMHVYFIRSLVTISELPFGYHPHISFTLHCYGTHSNWFNFLWSISSEVLKLIYASINQFIKANYWSPVNKKLCNNIYDPT